MNEEILNGALLSSFVRQVLLIDFRSSSFHVSDEFAYYYHIILTIGRITPNTEYSCLESHISYCLLFRLYLLLIQHDDSP